MAARETPLPALRAPFPWFGGKSRAAALVWQRFGDVPNYVEPFFGSGAVLLGRPTPPGIETVNDKDGFVANFWRALQDVPDEVARFADWPVNENDLHARDVWLRERRGSLAPRLEADPGYYDAQIAGWWVWGIACWIGGGFCGDSGSGPWVVVNDDEGVPILVNGGDAGRGVTRQLVHLGDAGHGVTRKLVHLGDAGRGVTVAREGLPGWFQELAARLRHVRVCCGDWARVVGPTPTEKNGLTGVFLDPPYSAEANRADVYTEESGTVAYCVREWAIANGDNPKLRIALCGYEGEHAMPDSWECVAWKAKGGYGNLGNGAGRENAHRERIWFSPHCLTQRNEQLALV